MSGTSSAPRVGLTLRIFGAIALVVALVLGGTFGVAAVRARAAAGDALTRALTGAREAARLFIDADRGKLASGASAAGRCR